MFDLLILHANLPDGRQDMAIAVRGAKTARVATANSAASAASRGVSTTCAAASRVIRATSPSGSRRVPPP